MVLTPTPCFKDEFPGESWPSGGCDFIKLPILLAAACIWMPSLGAARIVEKGMGVLKMPILLGLDLFAFVTEFLFRFLVLEINPSPAFPQPVTSMELNDRIEWRWLGLILASREHPEYIKQLATASQFDTGCQEVYDALNRSVLNAREIASRLALDDTKDTFRVWHISAFEPLVTPSTTVHWLYDPISGAVKAQFSEDTASSQLNTIPDLERATQYSISDGNTFLHPPPSLISSISQKIRTSDRHLGMTSSTEAETCPLDQVPSTLRLRARPEYPYGYQDGQLYSLRDSHSDLVWSNSAYCQLDLQSTEESGNHDSPGSRLKLEKMI